MNHPGGDVRDDDRVIKVTSGLLQRALGVPPSVRWRHDGAPRMLIESYLYTPATGVTFPRGPMHMIGFQLDGKTARSTGGPADSQSKAFRQDQFVGVTNRCVLVPKNTVSHWRSPSGNVSMAAVYVTDAAQSALETLIRGSPQPVFLRDGMLVALIRQLLRAAVEHGNNPPEYAQRLVDAFTAQLQWLACVNRASTERRTTLSDQAISKALQLVDEHLDEPITIKWLSDSVKITDALFRRRFKDVTGMPVHHYILTQRIQCARELIEETSLALSVIATYCGFSSQSHMTSVYKRELGLTPGEQRRI